MSRRAAGGALWTVGGYAAMQALRFAFNLLLARAVAPDVFGAMALVNVAVQGLQMFSDLGIRQCVVRHPRGDEADFLDTAWTAQVLRGGALWLAAAALAWPVAGFYGEPALTWLIPLAATNALIVGFTAPAALTCSRHVLRGPLVRREVGGYAVTVAATLGGLALLGPGATREAQMALLAGGAVFAGLLDVALSYTLPGARPPRFRWEADSRGQLLRFGGWVFVSTACTFAAAQADRLVVGKLSLELLGVYHIAAVIAGMPAALVAALGAQLAFPLLSEALRNGAAPAEAFARARRPLAVAAGLFATGAGCVGPAFVALVYDGRYAEAPGFVRLLAAAGWFTLLAVPAELLLLSLGRARDLALGQGVRLLALPGLLYAGYEAYGVTGLVLGAGAAEAARYAVLTVLARREGARSLAADAGLTLFAAAVAAAYLAMEPAAAAALGRPGALLAGAALLTLIWAAVGAATFGPPRRLRWPAARLRSANS